RAIGEPLASMTSPRPSARNEKRVTSGGTTGFERSRSITRKSTTPARSTHGAAARARARQLRGADAANVPAVAVAVVNDGFASASANALALENRSAGSFSSDFATAAATFAGTDFRWTVTGSAGVVMIFMIICFAAAAVNGGWPVSISYSTLPSEYTSERAVISFSAVACSGDM